MRLEYKFYFYFPDEPELKFVTKFETKEQGVKFLNEHKAVLAKIERKIYED